MAEQTIDIVIRMLARGDGAKVTQEQIREINRLAHETGEEGNKARGALLSLSTAGVALAGAFSLAANGVREFAEKQEADDFNVYLDEAYKIVGVAGMNGAYDLKNYLADYLFT